MLKKEKDDHHHLSFFFFLLSRWPALENILRGRVEEEEKEKKEEGKNSRPSEKGNTRFFLSLTKSQSLRGVSSECLFAVKACTLKKNK